jgi:hypothetical protein
MATMLTALTYNTHLFGTWTGIVGTAWNDPPRFGALVPMLMNCGADVIALQEIWSSNFVESLVESVKSVYPTSYYDLKGKGIGHPSNPSGLLLLMNKRFEIDPDPAPDNKLLYYDYIHELRHDYSIPSGVDPKKWLDDAKHVTAFDPIQDEPTGKGFLRVPVVLDGTIHMTLFVTHMPTSSGNFPQAINDCFKKLTDHVPHDDSVVLLLADFNVSETDPPLQSLEDKYYGKDRYALWIGPNPDAPLPSTYIPTLARVQLQDALRVLAPKQSDAPGYSVIGATNTCWRNFNSDKIAKNSYDHVRIDHMMCRGLSPQSITVLGTPPPPPNSDGPPRTNYTDNPIIDDPAVKPNANQWTWDDGGVKEDLSDHYPVIGVFSLP